MSTPVTNFRGTYYFLSNFFPISLAYKGEPYASVEHAYQAAKAVREQDRLLIQRQPSAPKAKFEGKNIQIRQDWNFVKVGIMLDLLRLKFKNPKMRMALIHTRDKELIEGNWWGDTFWGVCEGEGQNMLGKLLMHVRWEIQEGLE